jgi:hypothetical protein
MARSPPLASALLWAAAVAWPAVEVRAGSSADDEAGLYTTPPPERFFPARPSVSQLGSLVPHEKGCAAIEDHQTCAESSDGTKQEFKDSLGLYHFREPCVWCGGKRCTQNSTALCLPYFVAKSHFKQAQCRQGKPTVVRPYFEPTVEPPQEVPTVTPVAWWRPPHPTIEQSECLRVLPSGCDIARDMEVCLSSRDGRRGKTHYTKLDLYGEPCVWCGGGNCESTNQNLCGPFNYLMYGEPRLPTAASSPPSSPSSEPCAGRVFNPM